MADGGESDKVSKKKSVEGGAEIGAEGLGEKNANRLSSHGAELAYSRDRHIGIGGSPDAVVGSAETGAAIANNFAAGTARFGGEAAKVALDNCKGYLDEGPYQLLLALADGDENVMKALKGSSA
jgi:hypothetical protein